MIEAKIARVGTQPVSDFLTDDGSQRDGIYPAVEVSFIDTDTGERVAGKTYALRPRSVYETLDDVTADALVEAKRIEGQTAEFKAAGVDTLAEVADVPPEVAAVVAELESRVGDSLTDVDAVVAAQADVAIKP